MTPQADGLCEADRLVLQALVAEYLHTAVTVELLRGRLEGLIAAMQVLRDQGLKSSELLGRVVRVTEKLKAADAAKRHLEDEAVVSEELHATLIRRWRQALGDLAEVRDQMLELCFECDTPRVKPPVPAPTVAPKVYEVTIVRRPTPVDHRDTSHMFYLYVDGTLQNASTDVLHLLATLDGEPCRTDTRKLWLSPWLEQRDHDAALDLPLHLRDIPDDAFTDE